MSVKFVGLFTVLYIGLRTIAELWEILGDLSRPIVSPLTKIFILFRFSEFSCVIIFWVYEFFFNSVCIKIINFTWFPQSYTVKHFVARGICLIALPLALYVTFFYIHLAVLNRRYH